MIKAVLIDDEPKNIRILVKMVQEYCPDITIAGTAENGRKGIELICREKPKLVLLDIEMPYGNAFDVLDALQPIDFEIIFITAFENYSLKAFKYSAVDYLLKPVKIIELQAAVKRAVERIKSNNSDQSQLEIILNTLNKQQEMGINKLALPTQEGLIFISFDDIIRCEARSGYAYFHRNSGQHIVSVRNISEYEEVLPAPLFCRIHNSHLINLNYVKKYHKGRGGQIEMMDGSLLEVAIRRRDEFLARFKVKP